MQLEDFNFCKQDRERLQYTSLVITIPGLRLYCTVLANYINALAVSVLPFFEPANPMTLGGFFVTLGEFFYDIG
jgi:hypothetical protein